MRWRAPAQVAQMGPCPHARPCVGWRVCVRQNVPLEKILPHPMQTLRRNRCQTRTRPRKKACVYGVRVSGATIFAYVGGNPLGFIDPDGLRPNRPQWWNDGWTPTTPPGHCATAECAAGLPRTPSDNRSPEEVDFGQCKMVCQISLLVPVAMCNAAAGGGLPGTAAAALGKGGLCTWICK